jgi:N-acyl-D-amino-acid deacylase
LDIKIKNGKVFDGTGNPWFKYDIGVEDGRIIEIGNLGSVSADRVIDASGLVVCPGFIDIHSHSEFYLITNSTGDAKIYQGVTTELNGNCGISQLE